jgi:hypothetical protein
VTEPYNHDDDDDQPTLQRVAPTSSNIAAAAPVLDAFPDEATTANDLDVLGSHAEAVLEAAPIADARDFDDIDTQKMPVEVRADLLRASQAES